MLDSCHLVSNLPFLKERWLRRWSESSCRRLWREQIIWIHFIKFQLEVQCGNSITCWRSLKSQNGGGTFTTELSVAFHIFHSIFLHHPQDLEVEGSVTPWFPFLSHSVQISVNGEQSLHSQPLTYEELQGSLFSFFVFRREVVNVLTRPLKVVCIWTAKNKFIKSSQELFEGVSSLVLDWGHISQFKTEQMEVWPGGPLQRSYLVHQVALFPRKEVLKTLNHTLVIFRLGYQNAIYKGFPAPRPGVRMDKSLLGFLLVSGMFSYLKHVFFIVWVFSVFMGGCPASGFNYIHKVTMKANSLLMVNEITAGKKCKPKLNLWKKKFAWVVLL